MLNTGAAVSAAQRPFVVLLSDGTASVGATISLDGSESFASNGRTLTSFQWTLASVTGSAPVIVSPGQPTTTLQIPAASEFTVQLTVTDDQGGQTTKHASFATPAP